MTPALKWALSEIDRLGIKPKEPEPMKEYLYRLHARKGSGEWWPERDGADNRAQTIAAIEQHVGDGYDLDSVWEFECVDGKRSMREVTDEFMDELSEREHVRLVERFDTEDHDFASLAGYLEMADRKFPPRKRSSERDDGWGRAA